MDETIDQHVGSASGEPLEGRPLPGLLLVFSVARPALRARALGDAKVVIGRGTAVGSTEILDDSCLSRRHAEVGHRGGAFLIEDLGSRNGTRLDGQLIDGPREARAGSVLRVGDSLFLLCADLRPYLDPAGVTVEQGLVVGPTLRRVHRRIEALARVGDVLHVTGATGSGKELAARTFHQAGPHARGPFVAVNCATIPEALAERLLFGARKGAFSGADADAEGYLQSADRGTLFLDEIAELQASVQAKLLRVIETREVVPLGASRGRRVDLRIVSATHGDLREQVNAGRFREDLYYRLARPAVALPPLAERREELAFLAAEALRPLGLRPHASLIEAALLRPWPGNLRELLVELREAASEARHRGDAQVEASHLPAAPASSAPASATTTATAAAAAEPERAGEERRNLGKAEVERALEEAAGNISHAARLLGLHRTQLKRLMLRFGLTARPGG